MTCKAELRRPAEKFLRKAPRDVARRIDEKIKELRENPVCDKRLKDILKELCRTRVGPYRIAYQIKPCTIIIVDIGHREKFYDQL